MHTYKNAEYLVETKWLGENITDPNIRIYDCAAMPSLQTDKGLRKKYPLSPKSCRASYKNKHIPGAAYIDVPADLTDNASDLPMMRASTLQLEDVFRRAGINNENHVVLYSSENPMWATRVWWVLKSIGFENAAILNGGLKKWQAENRPISDKLTTYSPGAFNAIEHSGVFVDKHRVHAALGDDETLLIHALTPSVFDGSHETLVFGRRGHIPGSVNIPSGKLHESDSGAYLPAEQLHDLFSTAQTLHAKHIITYCGGGVNASNNAFALALLGYENVSIYDGSMCEWGNDPSLPIEI